MGQVNNSTGGGGEGEAGPQGPPGPQGPTGPKGDTGNTGPTGATGATGAQGAQGPAGNDGADGADGATGPQGIQGAQGETGPEGPQGSQGTAGSAGPAGADGKTWYSGSGVPSDATGVNGDHYLRTSNGDVYLKAGGSWGSPVANLTGPQGTQGNAGAQGPQGDTGATGSQGPAGADGSDGVDGADGVSFAVVPFHSDGGANLTLTNQANAEQFLGNSNRNITKIDLTNFTQVRLLARVVTASASANNPRIYAEYNDPPFSTTVGDYSTLGSSAVNCSLAATGLIDSGWIDLVAGAKADVYLTILMNGGDAAADPALGMLMLQFR